ncbi:GAF domain-containing protein [Ktedonobacteria bacterium brp13]|nr:GAF domain-containing protein [Ktedonobacteria bacterium brp13]
MSASIWGESDLHGNEPYPLALLTNLSRQAMQHFNAHGACFALYDEEVSQMRVQIHIRVKNIAALAALSVVSLPDTLSDDMTKGRRVTRQLDAEEQETVPMQQVQALNSSDPSHVHGHTFNDIEHVSAQDCELFPVTTTYPIGQDLIGYTWNKNDAYAMRHEDYLTFFRANNPRPLHIDATPSQYLIVPVREATMAADMRGRTRPPNVLGVIVLYRVGAQAASFQNQRAEALLYMERIALNLQNDALQRKQKRTSEYLEMLQGISSVFPTSVKLSELVENVYQFVHRVVDVSSLLLTLYDRDMDRLYDVFALADGQRVDGLAEKPLIVFPKERPVFWRVTQQEQQTLQFSPAQEPEMVQTYQELLGGAWGDQSEAESFLLLPMKMFNRVIGALCITSKRPNAFHQAEVQVLETMTQIVTVSIENTRLYERDRSILHEAQQREAHLAMVNSALQAINSVLNVTELLNTLVASAAAATRVDICVFFEPSPNGEVLVAHALYAPSSVKMVDDGSGLPVIVPPRKGEQDEIINLIQLPFKGTFLEHSIDDGFFYLDSPKLEELARKCNEGGLIFLHEMGIEKLLMVPMSYQSDFFGFLALPISKGGNRSFRPKDVGTVLAICAQTSSAIRNAQLFERREEANAELERINKLKDEFLVTASHELRTPLTAISGYSSQLKRQSSRATPQTVLRFATKISVAAQQLGDQVAKITEAAQIGPIERKIDLRMEPVQLLAALEVALNMLTLSPDHEVLIDVPPDLWFKGDPPYVRQVLTHLLENSMKYSPPGTAIRVSATAILLSQVEPLLSEDQADPGFFVDYVHDDIPVILVRVTDQGEGILLEDRKTIFDKFVRAPRSLTTPVRGTGLGLYICRRYIEAMDGKIWLEQTEPNEGSTFSFYLPQAEPPVEIDE